MQTPSALARAVAAGTPPEDPTEDRTTLRCDVLNLGDIAWGSRDFPFGGDNALTLRFALSVLECWATELEQRTLSPLPPPAPQPPPVTQQDYVDLSVEIEQKDVYSVVMLGNPTILQFFHDLWVDDCSWAMTPAVLDRPVGLLHCLLKRAAIQCSNGDPAYPVQMVGVTARGRRFRAFRTKLLAIGAALGHRQAGVTMDAFEAPITFPLKTQQRLR